MAKQRLRSDAGVTLLELMFASGVLALGLAMLFGAMISINVLGGISEERAVAASQVASVLEHMRSLPLEEILAYELPFKLSAPGVERALSVECYDAEGGTVSLPLAAAEGQSEPPVFPNPLEVKVTLVWASERGRPCSVNAATSIGR